MSSLFQVRTISFLLMTEEAKQAQRLSKKIEQPLDNDDPTKPIKKPSDLNLFYRLPDYLDLKGNTGASKSFSEYMDKNEHPHEQMVLAAHNVANAHNYLTSELFKQDEFNKDIYKHTVNSIRNAFNAVQKIGQQHLHGYLGDMLDEAREKHHAYMAKENPTTFIQEPHRMKNFKDDTKNLKESDRSEFSANMSLSNKSGTGEHHVYVSRPGGKKKSIAGPFSTPEAAEAHPARKWGSGVCKGSMCENVFETADMLDESRVFKTSKTFFNKKADKYINKKTPVSGALDTDPKGNK